MEAHHTAQGYTWTILTLYGDLLYCLEGKRQDSQTIPLKLKIQKFKEEGENQGKMVLKHAANDNLNCLLLYAFAINIDIYHH